MSNLEILMFGIQNIEISRFDMQRDVVTIRESGRLVLYPGDSRIIQESEHSGHPGFHRF